MKLSKGHQTLYEHMQKFFPDQMVVLEHHVGELLRLDIYCPKYKLAIEFHGRQHFEYSEFHHQNLKGFEESKRRDQRKLELCEEQGITVVVFDYRDPLDEDTVYTRVLDAIQSSPAIEKAQKQSRFKGNPYYEKQKERNREYRKEMYRRLKEERAKD